MKHFLPYSLHLHTVKGWTLVELLIAMTLSLLIIAGISQIYLAAKHSYNIQTSQARIQDVGRYVTEVLTQDIRRAGYWGLMDMRKAGTFIVPPVPSTLTYPTGIPSPPALTTCPTGNAEWGRTITQSIFGLNNGATGYACITGELANRDVLVMRYADPTPVTAFNPNKLYVRTAPYEASVVFGDPANCPPGTAGCTLFNYVTPFANAGNYDYELVAHAYYVTNSSSATECGESGAPALPAMARKELDSKSSSPGWPIKSELVTGVEDLQFQYGVDTAITTLNPAGDGSVNQYFNADQITCLGTNPCWNQVRAVRFWVLVKDDCPDPAYNDSNTYYMGDRTYTPNDQYRRALYTSTVALRN